MRLSRLTAKETTLFGRPAFINRCWSTNGNNDEERLKAPMCAHRKWQWKSRAC